MTTTPGEEVQASQGASEQTWRELQRRCPEFFAEFAKLAALPARRAALSAKVRELILIAINAAVTHLNAEALRAHIRAALRQGASSDEILEVLQLVSVLGIHAISVGYPALQAAAADTGRADELPPAQLNARQQALKAHFTHTRGYWNPFWEQALQLDPELFEAYFSFSSVPWMHGVLSPKVREFIYVAIDASTTHMFYDGTRGHMANALKHGATFDELFELLGLCATIGIQSMIVGLPILQQELELKTGAE